MYCTKCGGWMEDYEQFCRECGTEVRDGSKEQHYTDSGDYKPMKPSKKARAELDKSSIGLNILGFFIPVVGIVLFFVKRKEFPKKAKKILIWSIIGWVLWALINIGGNSNTSSKDQPSSSIVTEDIVVSNESNTQTSNVDNIVDEPIKNESTTTQKPETPIKEAETTNQPETVITYEVVDIQAMLDELDANALRAERTYQDKYIEVTGNFYIIDSDGKYFSIRASNDTWDWDSIKCDITDDSQLDIVLEKNMGDTVTIKGQVTDIGEIMGYVIDIHEIH